MTTDALLRSDLLARLVRACADLGPAAAQSEVRARLEDAGFDATVIVPDGADEPAGVHVEVPGDDQFAQALRAVLEMVVHRDRAERRARALEERFDTNQRLSGVGSYDWHIASNTNLWTNRLFRIYGEEPGAFEPSYEQFIARIHPDDRERIQGIHQRALEEAGSYQMHERIVHPNGQVRTLWSTGEVICDAEGTPVRMVGVCEDVTDKLAEEERIRVAREKIAADAVRRSTAMELNDNVVQGLTAVIWAIEAGLLDEAEEAAARTMAAARSMLDRMLPHEADELEPGHLVRTNPAPSVLPSDDGDDA